MSWLDPVRRSLDERPGPCRVFFRVDDAGQGDARLARMLDRFEAHALGVDVAVIPRLVRPALARDLLGRAEGAGVRLHQHGLAHVDHETSGRKHEFGPSRGLADQLADITAGRRLMVDAFGDHVDPVFTPPWNRCTAVTGAALLAADLRVLSRDHTAPPLSLPGLVEVPVTVDWFGHHRGERWTPDQLAERIARGAAGGEPVGVMLHHAVTDDAELARVDELLSLLAGHPRVRVTSIRELAGVTVEVGPAGGDR